MTVRLHTSIMANTSTSIIIIAVATRWNPVMVALAASIGGTLRELSGYPVTSAKE